MPKKKRKRGGTDELRDRVIHLAEELWDGNRSRMAADLDQHQPSITRLMAGDQAPSGKLLENLAKHPDVNLEWLFRGEGSPLVHDPVSMPVFKRLLDGSPTDAEDMLVEYRQSLAPRHYRPSRYWLRVQGDEPITGSPEEGVVAGDMILMETDRDAFRGPGFVQQLCGVKFGEGQVKLAMVDCYEADPDTGPACIVADTFDLDVKPEQMVRQYLIQHQPGRKPTVTTHEMVASESGKPRHKTSEDVYPHAPRIEYSQIVCMAVLVLRRCHAHWAV
jgi:SOS-response transcriptional repressor LexA